ncbi:Tubulin glycylase 3B [Diplonema papillatum]|nr:Tubulin glycylase 3B [Diplonema papillatum]
MSTRRRRFSEMSDAASRRGGEVAHVRRRKRAESEASLYGRRPSSGLAAARAGVYRDGPHAPHHHHHHQQQLPQQQQPVAPSSRRAEGGAAQQKRHSCFVQATPPRVARRGSGSLAGAPEHPFRHVFSPAPAPYFRASPSPSSHPQSSVGYVPSELSSHDPGQPAGTAAGAQSPGAHVPRAFRHQHYRSHSATSPEPPGAAAAAAEAPPPARRPPQNRSPLHSRSAATQPHAAAAAASSLAEKLLQQYFNTPPHHHQQRRGGAGFGDGNAPPAVAVSSPVRRRLVITSIGDVKVVTAPAPLDDRHGPRASPQKQQGGAQRLPLSPIQLSHTASSDGTRCANPLPADQRRSPQQHALARSPGKQQNGAARAPLCFRDIAAPEVYRSKPRVRAHHALPPPPPPAFKYTVYLNPKAGSTYVEVGRLLGKLPFWTVLEADDKTVRRELAAAKALTGRVPSVSLLLEDRYVADRIVLAWNRHHAKAKLHGRGAAVPLAAAAALGGLPCDADEPTNLLVNTYNGTKCLTLKGAMIKTLRQNLADPWSTTPQTFVLFARSLGVDERRDFIASFRELKGACDNIWIVKPSHRNKGIGIKVFDTLPGVLNYVDTSDGGVDSEGQAAPDAKGSKQTQWVVQKYLERPFLIHGRKFDWRAWCVVTPQFDIYVYQEGVMRTASEPYQTGDLTDELSHLTNHCIQETGPNFGKFEDGNEMWYPDFQKYLDSLPRREPGHRVSMKRDLMPQVDEIIKDTLLCAKAKLTMSGSTSNDLLGCFQLFGFDFMIDTDMKVWLIEINGSPASAEYLLKGMMTDLIRTVIEPMYPPPPGHTYDHGKSNRFACIYKNPSPPVVPPNAAATDMRGSQQSCIF